jgi:predicted RNA-binding Zn-ribbon protein involved in translation (DUF1610 family)
MTEETRRFIELSDISALEFACKKCGTRITRSIEEAGKSLNGCPSCGEFWLQGQTREEFSINQLAKAVTDALLATQGRNFQLFVQIGKPEKK